MACGKVYARKRRVRNDDFYPRIIFGSWSDHGQIMVESSLEAFQGVSAAAILNLRFVAGTEGGEVGG